MTQDKVTFDLGDLTRQDMRRVVQEITQAGLYQGSASAMSKTLEIGEEFLSFLGRVFAGMKLLDQFGLPNTRDKVIIQADENVDLAETVRRVWNERASDWGVVETAICYSTTIQTLMEFFKYLGPDQEEVILSLGSGPGFYETYVGYYLLNPGLRSRVKIICLDAAKNMTRQHREVLRSAYRQVEGTRRNISNVEPMTGSMTDLKFPNNSVGQIICNNSLQWVPDWQKAIREMQRVMSPKGVGRLYLFVHNHPMVLHGEDESSITRIGDFKMPELYDCLEANRFQLVRTRQMVGRKGTGQMGGSMNRTFVLAQYRPEGKIDSWKDNKRIATLSAFSGTSLLPVKIV